MKFKFLAKKRVSQVPKNPGVYAFLDTKEFLYVGKANNLKERVKNHFLRPDYKDYLFLNRISKIGFIETDSEIEALLLEAKLIKKYQPKYNVVWRDGKNYFFVAITREVLPKVFITHQIKKSEIRNPKSETNSKLKKRKISKFEIIGPFVDGRSLKLTLKYLRKVFPYYSQKNHPKSLCSWCHLKLCPGSNPDPKEYQKNIKSLIKTLKGEKQSVIGDLKKEMVKTSKKLDFETATKIRNQIWAFNSIFDQAKFIDKTKMPDPKMNWQKTAKELQKLLKTKGRIGKIEAYDISNIQGKTAAGSMVTFIRGRPDKNFYRRFKIRMAAKPNDVAMIKEMLSRRFEHKEWSFPDLILIDGGKAQLNAAVSSIKYKVLSIRIPIVALAKRNNELYIEGKKKPVLLKKFSRGIFNLILHLRDEAHRFAQTYHHKLRKKEMFN